MTLKKSSKHGSINYNLPIGAEADVIVAGSGPAGISASEDIAVSLQRYPDRLAQQKINKFNLINLREVK
jgi:hypothetical protein